MNYNVHGLSKDNKTFFSNKKLLYSIVLICFITRVLIAIRPIEYIDGVVILDDSYYSLKIAKSIASGLGPFISDNYTNGFQPLFVFLMVPVYLLYPNDIITPVHIALILSALFEAFTLIFIFRIILMYSKTGWIIPATGMLWIFNTYTVKSTLDGMETALSFFFIVLTVYYYLKLKQKEPVSFKNYFLLGIFAGLAALSRIDNFLLLSSLLLVFLIDSFRNSVQIKFITKNVFYVLVGCFLIYLPWLIYSYAYTGDFYPVSGKALRFYSLSLAERYDEYRDLNYVMLKVAAMTVILFNKKFFFFSLLSLLIMFIVLKRDDFKNSIGEMFGLRCYILLIFSGLIFIAYSSYIFTHWYFARYFYPISLQFIFLLSFIIDRLIYCKKKWLMAYSFFLIAFVAVMNIKSSEFTNLYFLKEPTRNGFMNVGNWAKNNLPPGTVIGAGNCGALLYFADNQKVINLDGVVNKAFYESCLQKKAIENIKNKKVEYIVDWQCYVEFIKFASANIKESDLEYLKTIDSFQFADSKWMIYKVNY